MSSCTVSPSATSNYYTVTVTDNSSAHCQNTAVAVVIVNPTVYKWTRVQQTFQTGTICTGPQPNNGCIYSATLWVFADTMVGYGLNNFTAPTTWISTVRSDTTWNYNKKNYKFWTPGTIQINNYTPYQTNKI